MSDDRWGWVTTPAPATTAATPAEAGDREQHFTNTPTPGAGLDALDLWAPAVEPPQNERLSAEPVSAENTDLAYSAVDDTDNGLPGAGVLEVGGHGPGDDAPTAQWPAITPDADGPVMATVPAPATSPAAVQDWTEQWQPAAPGDGLDELVTDGRAKRARARSLRRVGIVGGFVAVLAAVIVAGAVLILPGDGAAPPQPKAAGSAPAGWCATGTKGPTTTVASGGDQTSPTGVVAAFVAGLVDARSAAAAHAVLAPTAPAPTLDQLTGWIAAIPAGTNGWCAQITTTDSTARILVNLRLHAGDSPVQVGHRMTFYVSSSAPTAWAIDAIVSDEGSQP